VSRDISFNWYDSSLGIPNNSGGDKFRLSRQTGYPGFAEMAINLPKVIIVDDVLPQLSLDSIRVLKTA
jgi:hypothetical protein